MPSSLLPFLLLLLLPPSTSALYSPPSRGVFSPPVSTSSPNLVEGDMAVPASHLSSSLARDTFLQNPSLLWPGAVISYRFQLYEWNGVMEPLFLDSQMDNITTAMERIEAGVPCIKFTKVGKDYNGPHLIFTLMGDDNLPAYGCCSYVGRVSPQGGHRGQVVNLGAPECLAVGTVIHEILHAMGATHEHNRHDRDEYLKIHSTNIMANGKRNFRKTTSLTHSYRSTPFDPLSVMVYGRFAFGRDDGHGGRMMTIEPLEPGMVIRGPSSKTELSLVDKIELGRTYQPLTEDSCFLAGTLLGYTQYQDSLIMKNRQRVKEQEEQCSRQVDQLRKDTLAELSSLKQTMATKSDVATLASKNEVSVLKGKLATTNREVSAVNEVVRNQPHLTFCSYQNRWTSSSRTITYTRFLTKFKNGEADGELNLGTGVFTCRFQGTYSITYSAHASLHQGQIVQIMLYLNRVEMEESYWLAYRTDSSENPSFIEFPGSRTLMMTLAVGDTLQLKTITCSGQLQRLVFCINLTS